VELLLMDAEHVDEFGSRETRDDTTVINVQGDLHPLGKYYNGLYKHYCNDAVWIHIRV